MHDNSCQHDVFVGAGNVGLQAVLAFALVQQGLQIPGQASIVDFDTIEEKDVRKGYHRGFLGWFKAEAAVEMVKLLYGQETSSTFHPVVAAAQSVPGLLRKARAVFNGTDSSLDAAFVSEEACETWEVRMSTGVFGERAIHSIEVMPPGFTLGTVSYDSAAWADAAVQECQFGIPRNSFSGVAQPFGTVTGALAVQLFLARDPGKQQPHYLIRMSGEEIVQYYGSGGTERSNRASQKIALSYDHSLARLWAEVALRFGVPSEDIRLGFPIPIVTRRCAEPEHSLYQGFERHPIKARCAICGKKTFCSEAPREVAFEEIGGISQRSLRDLFTPAGVRFTAWTRDGRRSQFHLPYRSDDVPELPQLGHESENLGQQGG